jgi:WD40 repeat protein
VTTALNELPVKAFEGAYRAWEQTDLGRAVKLKASPPNPTGSSTLQPVGAREKNIFHDFWDTLYIYKIEILGNNCVVGMAVCFHHEEVGKLLVAEKNGIIHLYNILSHQAILSVDSGCIPLMSADWSPKNSLYVAAVAAGELLVWDISRPR